PGILALGLSLVAAWLWWSAAAPQHGVPDLLILGLSLAAVVAILWAKRGGAWAADANLHFKAVPDISTEGIVVYRAITDRDGRVVDFEYRYANPAACAIMKRRPEDVVGERLLERLPLAREHPQLFPRYSRAFAAGETSEAEYELGGRWYHSRVARLDDGVVVTVADISARKRADDVQKLLLQELNHRVKNLLASVMAMVAYTERGSASPGEYRDKLLARLHALSRAHSLLSRSAWSETSVEDVVRSTLEPHLDRDSARFQIDGAPVDISPDTALALNMALHELATNAAKYGALSDAGGRIAVRWMADADRCGFVRLAWTETCGPAVRPPVNSGFGARLLARAFASAGGEASLRFPPEGVICQMSFPTAEISSGGTVGAVAVQGSDPGGRAQRTRLQHADRA
ncbi:MAG: PAS domain-containing protein, partial [Hyphomicrobiales bacterium]|nr:PAS domain-containing protein [Hyphomicrobiales bacterium]